ncbi:hypothetical protein GCM10023187_14860 [Nibrella viscosa]|uniref:Lipoprotein n=1 Tax=Nibrella viscosa TaxID=1084524 RepID=A0ABP8K6M8_9BACT
MRTLNLALALILALLFFAGCKTEEKATVIPNQDPTPAILYNINTISPNGVVSYMGVYSEMPTSDPDRSKMVELGKNSRAYIYNNSVYTVHWDSKTISKWEVTNDLRLNKVSTLDIASAGLSNKAPIGFTLDTRAFVFDFVNGKVLEFNPQNMTITKTIPVVKAPFPYSHADNPRAMSTLFVLSIFNRDPGNGLRIEPRTTIARFDAMAEAVTYRTDDRQATSHLNVMDSQKRVYFLPSRDEHHALLFGQNADVKNYGKMIRFNFLPNPSFDGNFLMDLKALAGGPISHAYLLNDNELVVATTVEPLPAPINASNYFALAKTRLKKINLATAQVTDVAGVGEHGQPWSNSVDLHVDGTLYYPASEFPDGTYDKINTRLYKITGSSATLQFTSTNSWPILIGRVR